MSNQTQCFFKTFIAEMPYLMGGINHFDSLLATLQENLQNYKPSIVTAHVHKLKMGDQITYWLGNRTATEVKIIVDTSLNGNFQHVTYTAKNPEIQNGGPPYTSDLYLIIKDDIGKHHLTFTR